MAYAGTLDLTPPAANRVYQRTSRTGGTFGKGIATVQIALAPSAPVTLLEAQLRDANNPSNVFLPWFVVGSNLVAGQQTISMNLPANMAWFLLDLRANGDSTSIVSTANQFGVGEVVAAAGQSLATDFWDTNASGDTTTLTALGLAPNAFGVAFAAWNGSLNPAGWALPRDGGAYKSSFAAEFLRLAVTATGVNIGLVGYGYNGTAIASWLPGQPNYTALAGIVAQADWKFGTFLWCQGHQDAKSAGASGSAYLSSLQQLMASLAQMCGMPFTRILCSIPSIGTAAAGRFDAGSVEVIRRSHIQYVATDPLAYYVAGLDVALSADGIHPSQAGNITFARHFYRAFMAGVGGDAAADNGPQVVGATRVRGAAKITLRVQPATALAAVGDTTTQFQIFPAGQSSGSLPISSVDVATPGRIVITLASIQADTQALDVYYRLPWDSSAAVTSAVYDEKVDSDGLIVGRQLSLPTGFVTASAPLWHRPILVGPGLPLLLASGSPALAS